MCSGRPTHSCRRTRIHDFSPLFNNKDGKADLIIRSSQRLSFSVARSLLLAHSSIFADILSIPQPPEEPSRSSSSSSFTSQEDSIPVVDVSEGSEPLEIFLRYVVPEAYLVEGQPPHISSSWDSKGISLLEQVLEISNKYNCPMILDLVARQLHLPLLMKKLTMAPFFLVVRFGRIELAGDEMRQFVERQGFPQKGARKWLVKNGVGSWQEGFRDPSIGDYSLQQLERIPLSTIKNFGMVHAKVVASHDASYTWVNAADEFRLW
ncbi:hypothetical protein BDY24DRAFT_419083 [Mrakia frigida]|uniref:uncharacterized protein n=1 Tax=Mrakia frigida TaxID=29902 RepID=UPI003FCC20AE